MVYDERGIDTTVLFKTISGCSERETTGFFQAGCRQLPGQFFVETFDGFIK
jgi:hypothetical protein